MVYGNGRLKLCINNNFDFFVCKSRNEYLTLFLQVNALIGFQKFNSEQTGDLGVAVVVNKNSVHRTEVDQMFREKK